jgi:hypothetical protein
MPRVRHEASERQALRSRVKQWYAWFNRGLWEKCFSLIDPNLTEQSKVQLPAYAERLQTFKQVYGSINPWFVRISLHLEATAPQRDRRPFACVYVVWQDEAHRFHMLRERWVKDDGRWFTRVIGLVPNRGEAALP